MLEIQTLSDEKKIKILETNCKKYQKTSEALAKKAQSVLQISQK